MEINRAAEARIAKGSLYEQFARVGKVVGHPKRIEMLDLLCQRELSVEEVAAETSMTVAAASAQLQVLKRARMVASRRDGKRIFYGLADDSVSALVRAVQDVARARLAEVADISREFFDSCDGLDPIDARELAARIKVGDVVVIDVRPREEYEAGHIAGALSVPLGELADRIREIPEDAEVVAYCRGPYCVLAPQAVEYLACHGRRRVRRLDVGFPEWRFAGLPTSPQSLHE